MRPVTFSPDGLPRFTEPELNARSPPPTAASGYPTPVLHVAPLLESAPLKPFPEASWTVVPLPSANGYQATGAGKVLTPTIAEPLTAPPPASGYTVTVPVTWLLPAVKSPEALIVPIPPPPASGYTDQVKAGCVADAVPNWSLAVAANCFGRPERRWPRTD